MALGDLDRLRSDLTSTLRMSDCGDTTSTGGFVVLVGVEARADFLGYLSKARDPAGDGWHFAAFSLS